MESLVDLIGTGNVVLRNYGWVSQAMPYPAGCIGALRMLDHHA